MLSPFKIRTLIFILACSLPAICTAQDEFSFMTLTGINHVTVKIKGVIPDFEPFGLAKETLKNAIESRLRSVGISVIDLDDANKKSDAAMLLVKLTTNQSTYQYYSYHIALEVKSKTALAQNPLAFTSQTIWSHGRSGIVLPQELVRMNGFVDDLLTVFIKDFSAQNSLAQSR